MSGKQVEQEPVFKTMESLSPTEALEALAKEAKRFRRP